MQEMKTSLTIVRKHLFLFVSITICSSYSRCVCELNHASSYPNVLVHVSHIEKIGISVQVLKRNQ